MNGRRSTRRGFLAAVIGGVALLGPGRVNGVLADMRGPGHGGKDIFKSSCDQYGGTLIRHPRSNGLTICVWSDGSKTVCDSNGNDCTNYPPPPKKKLVDSGVDVADAPLIVDDTQTVTPVDAPLRGDC